MTTAKNRGPDFQGLRIPTVNAWLFFVLGPLVVALLVGAVWFILLHRADPDAKPAIGSIIIDLGQLDFALRFEDLQLAALFEEVECPSCDFSELGLSPIIWDESDPRLETTVGRNATQVLVHFYTKEPAYGAERIRQSLAALRGQFPDFDGAFVLEDRRTGEVVSRSNESAWLPSIADATP